MNAPQKLPFNRPAIRAYLSQRFNTSHELAEDASRQDIERLTGRIAALCYQEMHVAIFGKIMPPPPSRGVKVAAQAIKDMKEKECQPSDKEVPQPQQPPMTESGSGQG